MPRPPNAFAENVAIATRVSVTVESLLRVPARINVHHFVVDAYIWRVRRDGRNRRIVEAAAAAG